LSNTLVKGSIVFRFKKGLKLRKLLIIIATRCDNMAQPLYSRKLNDLE
jgi:hypothetical protein